MSGAGSDSKRPDSDDHDPIDRTQPEPHPRGDQRPPLPANLPSIAGITLQYELARGGMGIVYSGRQDFLDRRVAVKFLAVDLAGGDFARRFQREAKILAGIKHPNIVACHSAGTTADRRSYLVMEFIDGPTLKAWIREHGPVSCAAALRLTQAVAQALGHALSLDVIHRDIKAENILLETSTSTAIDVAFPFVPKVVDLGLARIASESVGLGLTSPGAVMGTPATMSPEQFDDPDSVDFRTDIYGLGCVLYEMLVGKPAYGDSKLTDIITKKRQPLGPDPCASNPSVPAAVGALVRSMLAADRDARPSTYAQLDERLETLLARLQAGSKRSALAYGRRDTDPTRAHRGPVATKPGGVRPAIWAVAIVLVLGGALALWFASRGDGDQVPAEPGLGAEPQGSVEPLTPPPPANTPPRDVAVRGPATARRDERASFTVTAVDPDNDALRYRWSSPQGRVVSFFPIDGATTEVRLLEGLPGDRFQIEVTVNDRVNEPVRAQTEVALAEFDPEDMLAGFLSTRSPWQVDSGAAWSQNIETLHVSCFARDGTRTSTRELHGETWRVSGYLESTPAGVDPPYADTGVRLEFADRGVALICKRDERDNKKWSMELFDAKLVAGAWTYTPVAGQRVEWQWATMFAKDWGWLSIERRQSRIEFKFGSLEQDALRDHVWTLEPPNQHAKLTLFASNGRGVFRQFQRW